MGNIRKWKGPLGPTRFNAVVKSFHKESDRAAGILAGSFVEHYLGEFLQEILVDDPIVRDLFNQPFAPLSSFSSRARLCFALKLIPKDFLADLDIIRDIRNHFAHHPLETSFGNPQVERLCSRLSVATSLRKTKKYTARDAYLSAVRMVVKDMHFARVKRRGIGIVMQRSSNQALLPTRFPRSR